MSARPTLVVVGGGLAGAQAATAARTSGFDGAIVIVGDEPGLPYERPPLSKAVLRGDAEPASTTVFPASTYADLDIEVLSGHTVERLDVEARELRLAGGDRLGFTEVVLATGAAPRSLDVPGTDLAGVHHLRTLDDARRLGDAIRSSGTVAVIGAGWIGVEVAASARQMGADVVLIDPASTPLQRTMGPVIGASFARVHRDHGVRLRMGRGVKEIRGADRAEQVILTDGTTEDADVVVVGIGVIPRTELAVRAGLGVDNGIVVDSCLEASAPGVFACGDVASAWHPFYDAALRVEHWTNALQQGRVAGGNAAGGREPYVDLPSFFSDQYDVGMEYVGHHRPDDSLVVRGSLTNPAFVAFWHRDGLVTAAMHVTPWDVLDDLRRLVAARTVVATAHLADPDIPLDHLPTVAG